MSRIRLAMVALALLSRSAPAQPAPNSSHDAAPARAPGGGGGGDAGAQDDHANALVRALLKQPLVLSTGPGSAAERFHLSYSLSMDNPDTGKELNLWVTVVRNDDRSAVLVRSGPDDDALPFCYATEGLVVIVDPTRPGSLAVMDGRHGPVFKVGTDEDSNKGLEFAFGWGSGRDDPERVLFDPASILRGMLDRAEEAEYDAATRLVTLRTRRFAVRVPMPAEGEARPLLGFGAFALILGPRAPGRQPQRMAVLVGDGPQPDRDYFVTRAQVEKLGLPIVVPQKEDFEAIGVPSLILPPDGFGDDTLVRRAAEKLDALFVPLEPPPKVDLPPPIGDLPEFKL